MKPKLLIALSCAALLAVILLIKISTPALSLSRTNADASTESSARSMSRTVETQEPQPMVAQNNPTPTNASALQPANAQTNIALSKSAMGILSSNRKNYRPALLLLETLQESDKPALLKEFRDQPLTNKVHALWALACLGGADVRDEFTQLIASDLHGVNAKGMHVMLDMLYCVGHMANSDSSAYQYLLEHRDPESWKSVRRWTIEDDKEMELRMNQVLSESCLCGIGISGRDDAVQALDEVMNWDKELLDKLDSALVSAHFYFSLNKNRDRKSFIQLQSASDLTQEFRIWAETDEGKKWKEWRKKRHP